MIGQQVMTDLDMLMDYRKDTCYAATCYTTMATDAHHDFLRDTFLKLAAASMMSQERASDLISQLGGIS